ncbi:MAG: small ribosomal subunit Rsm22 family protein, partial [Planctomycetes bacterium]|nr:small ribosomal subunit Rsm22 family protein [Planctomycetota bacterium]
LCLAWQSSPMQNLGPERALHDWGAGPMTGLIALWVQTGLEGSNTLASYTAVERQRDILDMGESLAGMLGIDKLVTIHSHPHALSFDEEPSQEKADILLVSQSFNEWLPPRGRSTEPIRAFAKHARAHVKTDGELFLMEPASRVVSWGVMELRNMLAESATILAPCTHAASCPLLDPRLKSWCHFRRRIVPHPLHGKLRGALPPEREAVSYSYLHARFTPPEHTKEQRFALARVISEPFSIEDGRGVYGCSAQGRILMATRSRRWSQPLIDALAPDSVASYPRQGKHPRDKKSRALKIWLSDCRKPDGSRYGAPAPAKKDNPS